MLAKREKLLLGILTAVISVAALGIVFSLGAERLRSALVNVGQYREQNEKLRRSIGSEEVDALSLRERLQGELAVMKTRFYGPGEMNPYSFGALIKKKLGSLGLAVVRYQVIEVKGVSSLEFSISGSINSIILLFKEVSESERYWTISSLALTMREDAVGADAVFRIGYEVRNH
jgi:hypothetical protein